MTMRLHHPATPGYAIDVPNSAADAYLQDGWWSDRQQPSAEADEPVPAGLADLPVSEPRATADEVGLEIPPKARKADLVTLITNHRSDESEGDQDVS